MTTRTEAMTSGGGISGASSARRLRGGARATVVLLVALSAAGCATRRTPLQVSVVPPVQLFPAATEVDGLRLDLPYGVNGVVRGLDVGVVGSATQQLAGVQLHLAFGDAAELYGVQLALNPLAALNRAERLRGLQLAGFVLPQFVAMGFNSADDMQGAQLATVGNYAGGSPASLPAEGAQVSLCSNYVKADGALLQLAVFGANVCNGNFTGLQATIFAGCDYVRGDARGVQVVPIGANVTRGRLHGIQVGPVNWASQVQGLQVGLLNYCHQLRGVQVGVANICREQVLPFVPLVNARF